MNIIKELDKMTGSIRRCRSQLCRELSYKESWHIMKIYLEAYIANTDKLVERDLL